MGRTSTGFDVVGTKVSEGFPNAREGGQGLCPSVVVIGSIHCIIARSFLPYVHIIDHRRVKREASKAERSL